MNLSTGWPDAAAKIAGAIIALCALTTALMSRCDQQKQVKALEYLHGTNYLDYANEQKK